MAQTTYTLEEAAEKLGITPEDMKRRIREEWKSLRSFRDGPTLRFRVNEIDELARTMGLGSDSEGPSPVQKSQVASDLDEKPAKSPPPPVAKTKKKEEPILFGDDDDEILAGMVSEAPKKDAPKSTSVVGKKKKPESDSDVRIETYPPTKGQQSSGGLTEEEIDFELPAPAGASGVLSSGNSSQRLKAGGSGKLVPTSQGGSGKLGTGASSSKLQKTGSGGSGRMEKPKLPPPPQDLNSEFELSLEDSDFELQLTDDSDEVDLGEMPTSSRDRDSAGKSGINIGNPADSGISLESKRSKPKSKVTRPMSTMSAPWKPNWKTRFPPL